MVSYHEMRMWARWLGIFTAQDMGDALGVPADHGEYACRALIHHDCIKSTGRIDEEGMQVRVYEYVMPPPGPKEHPHQTPPEIIAARQFGLELFDERGLPQRLVNDIKRRQSMSLPGERHKIKMKEKRWRKQQEANEERRVKALAAKNGDATPS